MGPGGKKGSPIYQTQQKICFEICNWQNDYVAIMNIGCTIQVAEIKQVTEKDETDRDADFRVLVPLPLPPKM